MGPQTLTISWSKLLFHRLSKPNVGHGKTWREDVKLPDPFPPLTQARGEVEEMDTCSQQVTELLVDFSCLGRALCT